MTRMESPITILFWPYKIGQFYRFKYPPKHPKSIKPAYNSKVSFYYELHGEQNLGTQDLIIVRILYDWRSMLWIWREVKCGCTGAIPSNDAPNLRITHSIFSSSNHSIILYVSSIALLNSVSNYHALKSLLNLVSRYLRTQSGTTIPSLQYINIVNFLFVSSDPCTFGGKNSNGAPDRGNRK